MCLYALKLHFIMSLINPVALSCSKLNCKKNGQNVKQVWSVSLQSNWSRFLDGFCHVHRHELSSWIISAEWRIWLMFWFCCRRLVCHHSRLWKTVFVAWLAECFLILFLLRWNPWIFADDIISLEPIVWKWVVLGYCWNFVAVKSKKKRQSFMFGFGVTVEWLMRILWSRGIPWRILRFMTSSFGRILCS